MGIRNRRRLIKSLDHRTRQYYKEYKRERRWRWFKVWAR